MKLNAYQTASLANIEGKIRLEYKWLEKLTNVRNSRNCQEVDYQINDINRRIKKLEWEYQELLDLYNISESEECFDLLGNRILSKKEILEEIENEKSDDEEL